MIVGELFLEFALLAFVAFGGATALLPEMHRVVVETITGWTTPPSPTSTPSPRRRRGRTCWSSR
jgi:hypothetical protein